MQMEIAKVREILAEVTTDPKQPPAEAIQKIALALLHMAEGIEDIRRRLPSSSEYM